MLPCNILVRFGRYLSVRNSAALRCKLSIMARNQRAQVIAWGLYLRAPGSTADRFSDLGATLFHSLRKKQEFRGMPFGVPLFFLLLDLSVFVLLNHSGHTKP